MQHMMNDSTQVTADQQLTSLLDSIALLVMQNGATDANQTTTWAAGEQTLAVTLVSAA